VPTPHFINGSVTETDTKNVTKRRGKINIHTFAMTVILFSSLYHVFFHPVENGHLGKSG